MRKKRLMVGRRGSWMKQITKAALKEMKKGEVELYISLCKEFMEENPEFYTKEIELSQADIERRVKKNKAFKRRKK